MKLFGLKEPKIYKGTSNDVLVLSRAALKYVDVGMYFFTDNTFSSNKQKDKVIRGVVLAKSKKSVIVLLSDEYDWTYRKDWRGLYPEKFFDDKIMKCMRYIPSPSLWKEVYWNYAKLNNALAEAEQPLINGLYWSWFKNGISFIIRAEDATKHLIYKGSIARIRYVMEIYVK